MTAFIIRSKSIEVFRKNHYNNKGLTGQFRYKAPAADLSGQEILIENIASGLALWH